MSENNGCRRSTRERKEKKIFTPDIRQEIKTEEKTSTGSTKKPLKKSSIKTTGITSVNRPCDTLPNGDPFCCDLCRSNYVCNPFSKKKGKGNAKEKVSRHTPYPRQKVDQQTGKVLMLCNACGISIDRSSRPKKQKEVPTEEAKQKYMEDAKQFALELAKDLDDAYAERLYCPSFQLSPCGCLQKYISAKGEKEESKKRAKDLLVIFKEAKKLSLQKCYNIEELLANRRSKRARNIGLGNGQKKSKQFESFVMTKREYLKKELCLCERASQKILSYSNNFLHKRLKTDERARAKRVKGKAELGLLVSLDDLYKKKCCIDNCVMMILTHKKLLESWRARAMSGQQEARRVLAEMLTPSGGDRKNCYKFINMVTGRSPGTIARVSDQMKRTGGDRSPPAHGLKNFYKLNPRRKPRESSTSESVTEDKSSTEDKQPTADKPLETKQPENNSSRKQAGCLTFEQQREQLIQLQKQLIESQIQIQQLVQQQMLQQTLFQHISQTDLTAQNLSSIQQMVNQLNQQLQIAQQQMQQPQVISLPSMLQMHVPNTAIQISQPQPPAVINNDTSVSSSSGHQIPTGIPMGNLGFHVSNSYQVNNQSQPQLMQPVQVPINIPLNIQMQLQQIQQLMQMVQQNAVVASGIPGNCANQMPFPQPGLLPPQIRVRNVEQQPVVPVMHQHDMCSTSTEVLPPHGNQYVFSHPVQSTSTSTTTSTVQPSDAHAFQSVEAQSSDRSDIISHTGLSHSFTTPTLDNTSNSEDTQNAIDVENRTAGASQDSFRSKNQDLHTSMPSTQTPNSQVRPHQHVIMSGQVEVQTAHSGEPGPPSSSCHGKSLLHSHTIASEAPLPGIPSQNVEKNFAELSREHGIVNTLTMNTRHPDRNNIKISCMTLPKLQKHSSLGSNKPVIKSNVLKTSTGQNTSETESQLKLKVSNSISSEGYVQKKHKAKLHHIHQNRVVLPQTVDSPMNYPPSDLSLIPPINSKNSESLCSSIKKAHTNDGVLKLASSVGKEKYSSSVAMLQGNDGSLALQGGQFQSNVMSNNTEMEQPQKVHLHYHLSIPSHHATHEKDIQNSSQNVENNSTLETSKFVQQGMSVLQPGPKFSHSSLIEKCYSNKNDQLTESQFSTHKHGTESPQNDERLNVDLTSNSKLSTKVNQTEANSYSSHLVSDTLPTSQTGLLGMLDTRSHYSNHTPGSSPHLHSSMLVTSDANNHLHESVASENLNFSHSSAVSSPMEANISHAPSPYDQHSSLHHQSAPHHSYVLSQDINNPHSDSAPYLNPHSMDRPVDDHHASASLLRMALLSTSGNASNHLSNNSSTSHRDPVLSSVQGSFRVNESGDNHLNMGEYMTFSVDALQQFLSQPGVTMVRQNAPSTFNRHAATSDHHKH